MKAIKPTSKRQISKMAHANEIITIGNDHYAFTQYLDREFMQKKHVKVYREYSKHGNHAAPLESNIYSQHFRYTRILREQRVIHARKELTRREVTLSAKRKMSNIFYFARLERM